MHFIGSLLLLALQVYFWIIILSVILSWLIAFEVINVKNEKAQNLIRLLEKATDPVYRPLRKYVPSIGGIDVTPIIVIFAIYLLQSAVYKVFMGATIVIP